MIPKTGGRDQDNTQVAHETPLRKEVEGMAEKKKSDMLPETEKTAGKKKKEKKIRTKEERIRAEKNRLNRIYRGIEEKRKNTVAGLIERAAYMRVTMEDFEKDLDTNGFTEKFRQGEKQEPYDRKRPVAEMYNAMSNSYQKAVKQLTDLLPKEENVAEVKDDGFDSFVEGRPEI